MDGHEVWFEYLLNMRLEKAFYILKSNYRQIKDSLSETIERHIEWQYNVLKVFRH